MTLIQLAVIALIQGITEFLPISSSGHLILIPSFTGWQDQGLVIDVAVHVGTLGAVMTYLWRDIWTMIAGVLKPGNIRRNPGLRLIAQLIVATIPLVIVGAFVYKYPGDTLRSAAVVGWATLGFGVLLYLADRYTVTINRIEHMTWGGAFTIGIAQIFALIPGASRAGTTITMAPVAAYLEAGVDVGLGVDGSASNVPKPPGFPCYCRFRRSSLPVRPQLSISSNQTRSMS